MAVPPKLLALEQELQAELEDAAEVRAGRLQEAGPVAAGAGSGNTVGIGGVVCGAVAADGAVHAVYEEAVRIKGGGD